MGSNYNIERGFITKLLATKDILSVKDMQIKPAFFTGDNRKAYRYINDVYFSSGEMPTIRVFKEKFPDYKLDTYNGEFDTEESLKFWCDELRKKAKHNTLVDNVEKIVDNLENMNTEEAYNQMKKTVLVIENEIVETSAIDITKDTASRKQLYLERVKKQGMLGIPMGIDQLDYVLKGMQNKQLITLIASTGLGKTWFECIIGAYAQLNNYRVLQITTEMSEEQMRDRYEAILMGKMCGEFNYSKFKSGKLEQSKVEEYFDFLDNTMPHLEELIIDTATGVTDISAKIDQYNPDLILIDGAYLLEDDRGADQDWLRIAHITRDLKTLAKVKNKPIFINSQADSNTSIKKGPELGNIGYSKAIGQDSDVVLALFRDENMIDDNEMQVKVLKQREGILCKVMINWDFRVMNFDPLYTDYNEDKQSEPVVTLNQDDVLGE